MINGKSIFLRALEPEDLSIIYEWENDTQYWEVSNTIAPFSKALLEKFIETSAQDIYTNRQMRLIVEEHLSKTIVGIVDIFEFDPVNQRAGIGILIAPTKRRKGYGLESIRLVCQYLFNILHVHQVFCNILGNNPASLSLFQKAGFQICGQKREWQLTEQGWQDEYILQLFNQ